jgi:hypothetical protein
MPVTSKIYCPECDALLVRRPGGCCPECGTDVRDHVLQRRQREKRIEQVVAVISTLLVIGVSLFVGGCSIVEGVVVYAVAGAVMYALAKKTFFEKGADRR